MLLAKSRYQLTDSRIGHRGRLGPPRLVGAGGIPIHIFTMMLSWRGLAPWATVPWSLGEGLGGACPSLRFTLVTFVQFIPWHTQPWQRRGCFAKTLPVEQSGQPHAGVPWEGEVATPCQSARGCLFGYNCRDKGGLLCAWEMLQPNPPRRLRPAALPPSRTLRLTGQTLS